MFEDFLYLMQGYVVTMPGVGEAQGAIHIASGIDFDDADTSMLLVVGTETAIMRATGNNFGRVLQRERARLVEFGCIGYAWVSP